MIDETVLLFVVLCRFRFISRAAVYLFETCTINNWASAQLSSSLISRDSFIFHSAFGLSLFVLAYTALLHDTNRDNVEWAWTLALFVLLVLAQCRTITLRIGLF